ncbi:MAG TPA: HAMP domain-containing protein, partial [Gelria sp.]|nr:HAMP domain-containing protein [Gelria sp.]
MTKGLGNKITTSFIIISVLAVIATSLIMLLMTRQQFSTYIDNYNQVVLDQWAPIISDYYSQYGSNGLQEYLQANTTGKGKAMGQRRHGSMPMGIGIRQGQRLIVADANNIVVADTQGLLIGQPAKLDSIHLSSRELLVDNQPRATLYIISPLGSGLSSLENQFVTRLTINTAILAILIGLIALILGLALGKRISSPLAALSTAIHKLANGQLDERLTLQGDREFMELGRDFNLMAQKLDDVEKNRRRLTADISHELRTPLTFLRGQLEGMQSG